MRSAVVDAHVPRAGAANNPYGVGRVDIRIRYRNSAAPAAARRRASRGG